MIAKAIAEYIEDRGLATVGSDLFIGEFPKRDTSGNTTQSGVYIVASGGEGQDPYLDTFYEDIDFWSVHSLYESAFSQLDDIRNVLSRATNYTAGDYYIYFSHDISSINDLGRSNDGLKIYQVSLRFIYRNTNLIS